MLYLECCGFRMPLVPPKPVTQGRRGATTIGLAARRDVVEILNQSTLFPNSGYEFAWRYPFRVEIQWSCGLSSTSLSVIVVHLKSGSTDEDANRRFSSCEELEEYVVSNLNDNIIIDSLL